MRQKWAYFSILVVSIYVSAEPGFLLCLYDVRLWMEEAWALDPKFLTPNAFKLEAVYPNSKWEGRG